MARKEGCAATETEMKEAKYRMEDALNATRAAVSEGIIGGGGSAYIHAQKAVREVEASLKGDEKTGAEIVAKALEAPLFAIAENACQYCRHYLHHHSMVRGHHNGARRRCH